MERKTQTREGGRKAFTLIELLIVIAIILILISIALPNFLEAQMRAKVTKAEAELRTIATAIEAYHTEWNRYPPQARYEQTQFLPVRTGPNRHSIMQLTTPIAYLTEIPVDPFAPAGESIFDSSGFNQTKWWVSESAPGYTYFYWSAESMAKPWNSPGCEIWHFAWSPTKEFNTACRAQARTATGTRSMRTSVPPNTRVERGQYHGGTVQQMEPDQAGTS